MVIYYYFKRTILQSQWFIDRFIDTELPVMIINYLGRQVKSLNKKLPITPASKKETPHANKKWKPLFIYFNEEKNITLVSLQEKW